MAGQRPMADRYPALLVFKPQSGMHVRIGRADLTTGMASRAASPGIT
jgi:hypothetical protein